MATVSEHCWQMDCLDDAGGVLVDDPTKVALGLQHEESILLNVSCYTWVTDDCLQHMVRNSPSLCTIDMNKCTRLEDSSLEVVAMRRR